MNKLKRELKSVSHALEEDRHISKTQCSTSAENRWLTQSPLPVNLFLVCFSGVLHSVSWKHRLVVMGHMNIGFNFYILKCFDFWFFIFFFFHIYNFPMVLKFGLLEMIPDWFDSNMYDLKSIIHSGSWKKSVIRLLHNLHWLFFVFIF